MDSGNYDFQKSQPLILINRTRADYLFKSVSYNFNQPQRNFGQMIHLIHISKPFRYVSSIRLRWTKFRQAVG